MTEFMGLGPAFELGIGLGLGPGPALGLGVAVAAVDATASRAAPHSGHFVRHPRELRSTALAGEFIFYLCQAKSCAAAGEDGRSVAASHSALISCGCSY